MTRNKTINNAAAAAELFQYCYYCTGWVTNDLVQELVYAVVNVLVRLPQGSVSDLPTTRQIKRLEKTARPPWHVYQKLILHTHLHTNTQVQVNLQQWNHVSVCVRSLSHSLPFLVGELSQCPDPFHRCLGSDDIWRSGGHVPAESRHVLGIAISGAVLFLRCRCSGIISVQWHRTVVVSQHVLRAALHIEWFWVKLALITFIASSTTAVNNSQKLWQCVLVF